MNTLLSIEAALSLALGSGSIAAGFQEEKSTISSVEVRTSSFGRVSKIFHGKIDRDLLTFDSG